MAVLTRQTSEILCIVVLFVSSMLEFLVGNRKAGIFVLEFG